MGRLTNSLASTSYRSLTIVLTISLILAYTLTSSWPSILDAGLQ